MVEIKCLTASSWVFRSYSSSSVPPNTAVLPCWRGGGLSWRRSPLGTAGLRHSPVLLWLRTKQWLPSSPHTHSIFSNISTVASVHSPFFISVDILLSSSLCIWKKGWKQTKTFFWECLGISSHVLFDSEHYSNLSDIIPNPAALALCYRAEEGKAQGNTSAGLPLCVSVTQRSQRIQIQDTRGKALVALIQQCSMGFFELRSCPVEGKRQLLWLLWLKMWW